MDFFKSGNHPKIDLSTSDVQILFATLTYIHIFMTQYIYEVRICVQPII